MSAEAQPRFALFGHPVSHSVSPEIHRCFGRQTGRPLSFQLIDARREEFAAAVQRFVAAGGRGFNVTVPLKELAFTMADSVAPYARVSGAVNTIVIGEHGVLRGDNTDGPGLIRDLTENHGIALSGRRVLLLGAGGAARGVIAPILECAVAQLTVANRTHARAESLAGQMRGLGPLTASGYDELAANRWDLIINATSASLDHALPPLSPQCIRPDTVCYDMMYAPEHTVFTRWARRCGALHTLTGTGMLVEQAALAFALWHGVHPDTGPVIARLADRRSLDTD